MANNRTDEENRESSRRAGQGSARLFLIRETDGTKNLHTTAQIAERIEKPVSTVLGRIRRLQDRGEKLTWLGLAVL